MGRLDTKRALVTGASSGIGRAVANRFAREGAHVAVGGRNPERTQRTVDEIVGSGGKAFAVLGDVSDEADARNVVAAAVVGLGGLDTLVNNAGVDATERCSSVSITPGMSVFERIPSGPYSTAMWSESMLSPAFEMS